MDSDVSLREVLEADLPIFFAYELDPDARAMAAFTSKDPANREAFMAHWHQILADPTTINRTIVVDGQVAGSVSSYYDDGHPEVTYWLGKHYWGKGLATRALSEFLAHANRMHFDRFLRRAAAAELFRWAAMTMSAREQVCHAG